MAADFIPHTYDGLDVWLSNFMAYLTPNLVRLGISDDKRASLQNLVNVYHQACTVADSPNAGSADRLDRKEKATDVIAAVRHFINSNLWYNEAVTDQDRVNFGMTVPDTNPTPVATPTTWPVPTVKPVAEGEIAVHYIDSAAPLGSHAKPAGVHGAEIRHAILSAPPVSDDDLIHSDFSTRSPHIFVYDMQQRGLTVYFRLRWENNRGIKGPWSPTVSAIIP